MTALSQPHEMPSLKPATRGGEFPVGRERSVQLVIFVYPRDDIKMRDMCIVACGFQKVQILRCHVLDNGLSGDRHLSD